MKEGKLLYLRPDALLTHPKNLRRFYPKDQVREMAESIKSANGVYEPLLIVLNGKPGRYFVVDGNIRLAGGRLLGKDCPPLECKVMRQNEAEQLLTMIVTAKFRYDPDPISEALHYRRLIDEEGYSPSKIAQATGIAVTTIDNRLKLLTLEPEIQELIGNRKLPADRRATNAFLSVPDTHARVKLAQRLANDGVTIKAIVTACERLATRLKEKSGRPTLSVKTGSPPALAIGAQGKTVSSKETVKWDHVRDAVKAVCKECDIRLSLLKSAAPEPAWSLIAHAAEETCGGCNVRDIKGACNQCPAVDIIRRLACSKES